MKQFDNAGTDWEAVLGTAGLCPTERGLPLWDPTTPKPARARLSLGSPNPTLFPPVPTERGVETRCCTPQESLPATEVRRMEMPRRWVMGTFIMKSRDRSRRQPRDPSDMRGAGLPGDVGFLSCSPSAVLFPQAGRVEAGWQAAVHRICS